jgi:transposase
VKTNKNDYIDAEAIAEAVGRAQMRCVPIKSDDQLDMQSLRRVRDRWVRRRTSVINQMRGLLLERRITFRKGRRQAEASLPGILEDPENGLSGPLRKCVGRAGSASHQGHELWLTQRPDRFAQTKPSPSLFAWDNAADHT